MDEPGFDRQMMDRLAKALAFICGAEHATTLALKTAAQTGAPADIKKARSLFLKLKSSERNAALGMIED